MACTDFIIWIGQSYKTIEDYVQESTEQGCCRRVQCLPIEAIPGISRVFLIHKDERPKCSEGSIFAYYFLDRVEIITEDTVFQKLKFKKSKKIDKKNFWSQRFYDEFLKFVKDFRESYEQCSDGDKKKFAEKIRKKRRKGWERSFPRRVAQGEFSGDIKVGPNPFDQLVEEIFWEYLEYIWKKILEKWESNDYDFLPKEEYALLQGGAGCSKRETSGAIYLVDALAREIGDAFKKRLENSLKKLTNQQRIQFIEKQKETEASRDEIYPEEGVQLWRQAMKDVLKDRKSNTEVPSSLKGKAKISSGRLVWDKKEYRLKAEGKVRGEIIKFQGELVVFNKPYPIFKQLPKASFRGYRRIDGVHLLRQISNGERELLIPYCPSCIEKKYEFEFSEQPTRNELIEAITKELLVSKHRVNRFLDNLTSLTIDDLGRSNLSFFFSLKHWLKRTGSNK